MDTMSGYLTLLFFSFQITKKAPFLMYFYLNSFRKSLFKDAYTLHKEDIVSLNQDKYSKRSRTLAQKC